MKRREFLVAAGGSLLASSALARAAEKSADHPLAPFDHAVDEFMSARKVPGGALAVVKDRRLVYTRGFGWADREKQLPAKPESLFRIASISKPITAAAVMKLIEQGKIKLTDRAFDFIALPPHIEPGKSPDARLKQITIRQLLDHTGGWDRDKSYDAMFRSHIICPALGVPSPADQSAVIRYMLGQPLDFAPGERYAYSNFGYCVLGRVIEKISGQPYEQFMKENVLAPAGIRRMRLGATLSSKQAEGEVRYYTPDNAEGLSLFPGAMRKVPMPYGAFNLEAMDAHGGWLASAVDLARFAAALDDPARSPLLQRDTIRQMYEPPAAPAARGADGTLRDSYYACGWNVRPNGPGGRANCWHGGSLPGTSTLLVRRGDGLSFAVLFNQRSSDKSLPDGAIDGALRNAAAAVKEWPGSDLFPRFA